MPNESIELEPKRKPVIARLLVPVDWTLWSIMLVVLLYGLVRVSTERTTSPEAGRGLGIFAIGFLLALLGVAGVFLNAAARRQSRGGLIALAVILAWPVVFLIADPAMRAYKERRFAKEQARVGDFTDAALASMARAVARKDSTTLAGLLKGQPPPGGKDRAGNDLLAYALVTARDMEGAASVVRVLLDAGADPRLTRMGTGEDPVNYMIGGHSPDAHEALRLQLEHGADPNMAAPESGSTPLGTVYEDVEIVRILADHGADLDRLQSDGAPAVVRFIGTRQWDSALHLIEKGANLDLVSAHGLSVDYYLNDWKESVFGEHPDGWDKVRAAIAARRAART